MKIFSLRSGRRGSLKVRRRAAEIVIDELFAGTPSELGSSESAKLDGARLRRTSKRCPVLPGVRSSAWPRQSPPQPYPGDPDRAHAGRDRPEAVYGDRLEAVYGSHPASAERSRLLRSWPRSWSVR
jgi:hypothetical protein